MRAVASLLAALAFGPTQHAATIDLSTKAFAPSAGPLTISAQVDQPVRLGIRLARPNGRAVGWIDPPALRSETVDIWDGTLEGRPVPDGYYQAQLVAAGRVAASATFHLDRKPALLRRLRIASNSAPFAGDGPLLATLSPNGDGFREYARIGFDLSEPATVELDVERTGTAATAGTIYTRTWGFRRGPHSIGWMPAENVTARTYVLSLTTIDPAGNQLTYGSPDARVNLHPRAPVVRVMGIDASFQRQSYAPGQVAALRIATDEPSVTVQVLKTGPERMITYADSLLEGEPVTTPTTIAWAGHRDAPASVTIRVGAWPSGLYYAKLTAEDGTIGYAPFVVRPSLLGLVSRVAVVLPTNTWQAYNFWDADGNGWGDTWYAGYPNRTVVRNRPYLRRGVPPFFYRYDQGFLHWLYWNDRVVDFLAESDLDGLSGDDLARDYDLVVYPGHSEYVTTHEYDVIERYRDLGGNLIFLSANNFFWHVTQNGIAITRDHQWRNLGRPEAALIGVQYLANDRGEHQAPFTLLDPTPVVWLWAGTGLEEGSTLGEAVGGYGIEIDHTAPESPASTVVLAQIPDLFGPGLTAQMTYYETSAGAKVFAAGALDFGGSALTTPVSTMLDNLWARLAKP
ncbi:MAG: N,N-dimethylformamidase beta subunit family domain-containing protein [Verrucomicrobiota bacterium]